VLAGRAAPEVLLQALPNAQQSFPGPFDADELEQTIARTIRLQARLADPAMRELLREGEALPRVPLFAQLSGVVRSEGANVGMLTEVVIQDRSIVDRMLRLVNSSFFGLSTPVVDPRDAIAILGSTTLQALVLNLELFRAARDSGCPGLETEELRAHALEAADLASHLVMGTNVWNHARVAAMLHDLGRVVLGVAAPDDYARVLALVRNTRQPLTEVEYRTFGFTHADLGACAASLWGLPWSIVEPIAVHHDTSPTWFDEAFDARHAVYVAELLLNDGICRESASMDELTVALAVHGLEGELSAWRASKLAAPREDSGSDPSRSEEVGPRLRDAG